MNILVVDDHSYNRDLLLFILEDEGHSVIEAENGQEACETYENDESIDLILMDVNMPEMDGITATKAIKESSAERFTPVIFITALDDTEMISRCLAAGGDDFVPKPVNENVLLAKINAHARSQALYNRVKETNKALEYHKQVMDREHAMVEQVFTNCSYRVDTQCDNLLHYTSPMSLFNGDLVLVSPSPSGGVYFLIGDFTGHGLTAAVGSLPVTEIFFNHIQRQASVSQMAAQINSRLHELLPTNMFFCAVLGYLDREGKTLTLWSGGMNDILWLKPGAQELQHIVAAHLPLGIQPETEFEDKVQVLNVEAGDRFVIYTDGVNESVNTDDQEFGLARLESLVLAAGKNIVDAVTQAVKSFTDGSDQSDDISIIELIGGPVIHRNKNTKEKVDVGADYFNAVSFPWQFTMRLEVEELKKVNPVTHILDFLANIPGIELHLDKIFTIVSELYSNALEHGVLELDSTLKQKVDGFELYYAQRQERLEKLGNSYIAIDFSYHRGERNQIEMVFKDSGKGFDFARAQRALESNDNSFGRGISLLTHLCSRVDYSDNGSKVRVVYDLCQDR